MSLDSKRWQQIQDVYYAALERAPDERATFLDEACRGDRQLRIEVDSLISSHQEAGSFLASPALEVAAKTIATEGADPITGKQIGHYKVMALLGRGGMGEVYLAEDTRLGRRVALKLLPAYFTGDEQRLARFQREARAASALNHPNIITIFEIGQSESIHYISAEHIEGETLRQRLSNARMSVTEALDVAIQAASALAAAHEAGIIHRDIKPENVMLRPDGYVKVLDFGLAKLAEGKYSGQSSAPTMANISTDSGIVMGTASYMSPEQARGQKVDARTDIFSLGVVLYEMIAGRQPFEGETAPVVISLILGSEPTPLARYSNEVPQSLEWIITKSLTKNRDERYQTAKDLLVDLKRVRKHLEYEAAREQSVPPRTSSQFDEVTIVAPVTVNTNAGQVGQTAEMKPERTTSSAEVIIGEIKRHKKVAAAALVVLALVLGGIGYQLYRLAGEGKPKAAFQTMKVTRLTTSGNVTQAAISPDGKYVAYTTSAGGQQSIWLKHIPTSSDVQIVPPSKGAYYTDLLFSPDGNFVCYVHNGSAQPANGLYRIPVLGGSPKKVTERVHGGFCFSPDGQRIALTRWKPYTKDSPDNNGEKQLMIINADGSSERRLTSRFAPTVLDNPAWSPDGRVIACTVTGAVDSSASVILVQVEDGSERTNWPQKWFNAGHLAWLQDGSGLVVPASDTPSSPCQIWHISYPGGEARRITNDLNSYNNVSLTSDSRT
ncbi:MAG TPA: protein kinase, partial [Blastocatellia bacterium]|nr:protein kinase [Blastocatellia bacterium]